MELLSVRKNCHGFRMFHLSSTLFLLNVLSLETSLLHPRGSLQQLKGIKNCLDKPTKWWLAQQKEQEFIAFRKEDDNPYQCSA